jgi:hypothetical protein
MSSGSKGTDCILHFASLGVKLDEDLDRSGLDERNESPESRPVTATRSGHLPARAALAIHPRRRAFRRPSRRAAHQRAGPLKSAREQRWPAAPAHTTTLCRLSKKGTVAMFKASTPLLRALMARWTVKINDDVAPSRGRHIKHGRFSEPTYRDPRFPTMRRPGSFRAGSFPAVGRAP